MNMYLILSQSPPLRVASPTVFFWSVRIVDIYLVN